MHAKGTALITGGAGGLGRAFASAFAETGHPLILVDKLQDELVRASREIEDVYSVSVEILSADLTSRDDVARVAQRIAACGDLEILVNNAGFGMTKSFAESDVQKNIDMIDVHVVASVWFSRAAIPEMIARERGYIINVASLGGLQPGSGGSIRPGVTYGATKGYLVHFSKSLQEEVRRAGVRIQALCPGYIKTNFHRTDEYSSWRRSSVPTAMWMTAEDVVAASLTALRGRGVVCIPGFLNRCLLLVLRFPITIRVVAAVLRRLNRLSS